MSAKGPSTAAAFVPCTSNACPTLTLTTPKAMYVVEPIQATVVCQNKPGQSRRVVALLTAFERCIS